MLRVRCEQENGPTRVYQFDDPTIRIGFRAEAHLSLEPEDESGAEIAVSIKNEQVLAQVTRVSGRFQVNGKALTAPTVLEPGNHVVTVTGYKIWIEQPPPEVVSPKASMSEQEREEAERLEREEAERAAEIAKKKAYERTAASYLLLFFEPVRQYLEDPDVSEIMINGPAQIYVEKRGQVALTEATFMSEQALMAAVQNVARAVGRMFNKENPRLDARLPDGSRVHAVIPPLARKGTVVAIRKFSKEKLTIEQLIKFGSINEAGANLLRIIVQLHKNCIVSGATSSGKTSVLNVLSRFIAPNERILVLEDSSELQLQQEHTVCFETRKPDEYGKGEVTIRDLLHSALRLRPDRVIVGEIRSGEALDLLQAMNTGHDGSLSTIHANSPRDSLSRLETCSLLSGIDIPLSALREQIGSAIHCVVQTARLFDGSRRITQISEVLGLENGQYKVQDLFLYKQEGIDKEGKVVGQHLMTGNKPTFYDEGLRRGMDMKGLLGI